MPDGQWRIVGPVRTKRSPNHLGFITQKLEGRRWRYTAVTYFGDDLPPFAKVVDHISSALMLRGRVESVWLTKAFN